MKEKKFSYLLLPLLFLFVGILLVSCGSDGNVNVVPLSGDPAEVQGNLPEEGQNSLPPVTDPYYEKIIMQIVEKKWQWEEELGVEQGVQRTVDWINGAVVEPPLPEGVIPDTIKARVSDYDPKKMKVYFYKRGYSGGNRANVS